MILAGQILGQAAFFDGKNVVQTQTSGAEPRGTIVKSEVIISDEKIGFPAIRKCDILLAMHQESITAFLRDLKENGILLIDTSNVANVPETKAKIFKIPATETAKKIFGERIYANMIMLGALIKTTNVVSKKSMERAIHDRVSEKTLEANLKAYQKGLLLS